MQMPPNPAGRHVHADTTVRNEIVGAIRPLGKGKGDRDSQTTSDLLKLFMAMQFGSGGWGWGWIGR